MLIHEYQAKAIFQTYDIPTLRGYLALSAEEAVDVAKKIGGNLWVVKAQIHAGGRGKAGGVKLARSVEELHSISENLIGTTLVTPQTGAGGRVVQRLYIEEGAEIEKELYAAIVIDRLSQQVCLMLSAAGGMDIEEVAASTPDKILKYFIRPGETPTQEMLLPFVSQLDIDTLVTPKVALLLTKLYKLFWEKDASLVEINPLVITRSGDVLALDAKLSFDDSAIFRHPEYEALHDDNEEDPNERKAQQAGLNYIQLDGNIACMVNGAGLAMATMDAIKLYGGEPANFLDVGGGATVEKVTEAFKIMLGNRQVKAILVNIFGGIMHCDTIAEGIVAAARITALSVPLIVRMHGTNDMRGQEILKESGLPIIPAQTLAQAAQLSVKMAQDS